MKRYSFAVAILCLAGGSALAQTSPPPRTLPPSLDGPPRDKPVAPLSAAEAARQRDAAIKSLKENLRNFDPETVSARQVEGRWTVVAGHDSLKDLGSDRSAAAEAARVIRDLHLNQLGSIAGASPSFEYWLVDGKAPRGLNSRIVVLPVAGRTIRAEQIGGTWALTDGLKGLYDFGTDADAAKRAALVFWKYEFNQVGVIGGARPTMLYPLRDPRQASVERAAPLPAPTPLGVYNDIQRTSLLLPGNVYGGPRAPIDVNQLKIGKVEKVAWTLSHGSEALARFGTSESAARSALKALQDTKPTEIVRIGEVGWPLFLENGQPVHAEPLGIPKITLRVDRMKVTKVRDTWWLFEEIRPVLEVGKKEDAELMLAAIRYFDFKNVSLFGRPEAGGLRFFTAGR